MNKPLIITAHIISHLFGVPWMFILVWLILFQTDLTQSQIQFLLPILAIFEVVIPFIALLLLRHQHQITDWDITHRKQRYTIMAIFALCSLISLGFVYQYGNLLAFQLLGTLFVIQVITTAITHLWKISLHMAVNTAGAIFINFLVGWNLWWLFLILPLVAWSRYILRRHTAYQLVGGTLASLIICFLCLNLLQLW
jgi:membrane-associated phospholipid phosphatase